MTTALILTSAFLHAAWNVLLKGSVDRRGGILAIFALSAALSTLWAVAAGQTFVAGARGIGWAVMAGVFEAGYGILLAISLERTSLAWAYAIIRGVAMLAVWATSVALFGERFGWSALIGVAAVGGGLVVLTNLRGDWRKALHNFAPYVAGLCIGGANLCYKTVLTEGGMAVPLFAISMWVSLPLLLWFRGKKSPKEIFTAIQAAPVRLNLAALLSTLSFIMFLYGMRDTGAGYATTLRNSSVVFAQLFGLWLGEKVTRLQWWGVALIVGGVAVLNL